MLEVAHVILYVLLKERERERGGDETKRELHAHTDTDTHQLALKWIWLLIRHQNHQIWPRWAQDPLPVLSTAVYRSTAHLTV